MNRRHSAARRDECYNFAAVRRKKCSARSLLFLFKCQRLVFACQSTTGSQLLNSSQVDVPFECRRRGKSKNKKRRKNIQNKKRKCAQNKQSEPTKSAYQICRALYTERPPPNSLEFTVTAFIFEKLKIIKICKFAFPASMTDHSSTKFNNFARHLCEKTPRQTNEHKLSRWRVVVLPDERDNHQARVSTTQKINK